MCLRLLGSLPRRTNKRKCGLVRILGGTVVAFVNGREIRKGTAAAALAKSR
jgi:hypothetical protein